MNDERGGAAVRVSMLTSLLEAPFASQTMIQHRQIRNKGKVSSIAEICTSASFNPFPLSPNPQQRESMLVELRQLGLRVPVLLHSGQEWMEGDCAVAG